MLLFKSQRSFPLFQFSMLRAYAYAYAQVYVKANEMLARLFYFPPFLPQRAQIPFWIPSQLREMAVKFLRDFGLPFEEQL